MRCRECAEKATVHVTEIEQGERRSFHLCKDHARQQFGRDDLFKDRPCEIDVIARPWREFASVRIELLSADACTVDGESVPRSELADVLRRIDEENGPLRVELVAAGLAQARDLFALATDLGVSVGSVTTLE